MKNFRKVLALILVVATLFSFVAMASARTPGDYADYDEVKNVVAVDIMTALGITEGYDGKYHPADTIDRDEVAAMVARLRNGGKFDATYYVGADNVFADVKGQWSEGYVTYCAQLGIIAGLNATTFNPDGQVTVVEVAKMLLCVLGWDAAEQGYVANPNWKVAVIRDAEKMGLLAGIPAADAYKAATRDQVALMFFNALQARLVYGYVSENLVKMTNSLLTSILPTLPDIANPNVSEDSPYELAYNNAIISPVTLGEILGVDDQADVDCYGRPGTRWTVGSWSKFYKDAPVNATVNGADPKPANTAVVDVYVNGAELGGEERAAVDYSAYLGKGVEAEAYAVEGGVRIVLINTYFDTVTRTSARYGKAYIGEAELEVADTSLKVGDVVAFTVCDGTCGTKLADVLTCDAHDSGEFVHSYAVVTPVTVKVDETHRWVADPMASWIITDKDAKYEYAFNMGHEKAIDNDWATEEGIMSWKAKGKSVDLYLANGYIQYWCPTPAAGTATKSDVAYFVEGSNKFTTVHAGGTDVALGTHTYAATADIVKMDATEVKGMAITIDDNPETADTYQIMLERGQNLANVGTKWDGILAQYNTANGQMTKVAEVAGQDTWLNSFTGELVNEEAPNGLNYHFDANTRFLVRTWDIATGAPTYTAVTGYKAMPEYLGKLVFGDQKYFNTIQYLATADGYVTDLFIDAFYAKTTAEVIYVLSKEREIGVAGLGDYFTEFAYYKAYVNGEVAYVAYFNVNADDNNDEWTGDELEVGKMYVTSVKAINGTYNDLPIYVAMTETATDFFAVAGTYSDVVVKSGQIELWTAEGLEDIIQSAYLADLTVYVLTDVTDGTVVAGVYSGTDFVQKYQGPEYELDTTGDIYGMGDPIHTLVLKIK